VGLSHFEHRTRRHIVARGAKKCVGVPSSRRPRWLFLALGAARRRRAIC
jgi:hypothetical protein